MHTFNEQYNADSNHPSIQENLIFVPSDRLQWRLYIIVMCATESAWRRFGPCGKVRLSRFVG